MTTSISAFPLADVDLDRRHAIERALNGLYDAEIVVADARATIANTLAMIEDAFDVWREAVSERNRAKARLADRIGLSDQIDDVDVATRVASLLDELAACEGELAAMAGHEDASLPGEER